MGATRDLYRIKTYTTPYHTVVLTTTTIIVLNANTTITVTITITTIVTVLRRNT